MNTSQSFDRAAGIYDQTRPLPAPAATRGIEAILDITGTQGLILDAGTGTGRISIPLLQRGVALVGLDLSRPMLRKLREKATSAPLAQADASLLPFSAGQFSAVLTVHVMHLVGPWQQALNEFSRVLRSGGSYLNIRTYEPMDESVRMQMRGYWRRWLSDQGFSIRSPGIQDRDELVQAGQGMGATVREVEVVRYSHTFNLREELERFQSRVYSDTWQVPDELYEPGMQALQAWTSETFGTLDRDVDDQVRFVMDIFSFDR